MRAGFSKGRRRMRQGEWLVRGQEQGGRDAL